MILRCFLSHAWIEEREADFFHNARIEEKKAALSRTQNVWTERNEGLEVSKLVVGGADEKCLITIGSHNEKSGELDDGELKGSEWMRVKKKVCR